jgi:hypothetical protein
MVGHRHGKGYLRFSEIPLLLAQEARREVPVLTPSFVPREQSEACLPCSCVEREDFKSGRPLPFVLFEGGGGMFSLPESGKPDWFGKVYKTTLWKAAKGRGAMFMLRGGFLHPREIRLFCAGRSGRNMGVFSRSLRSGREFGVAGQTHDMPDRRFKGFLFPVLPRQPCAYVFLARVAFDGSVGGRHGTPFPLAAADVPLQFGDPEIGNFLRHGCLFSGGRVCLSIDVRLNDVSLVTPDIPDRLLVRGFWLHELLESVVENGDFAVELLYLARDILVSGPALVTASFTLVRKEADLIWETSA